MSNGEAVQRPIEMIPCVSWRASWTCRSSSSIPRAGANNEPAEPLLGVRFDEVGVMETYDWLAAFRPGDEAGAVLPADEVPILIALRERRPVHGELWITGLDGVRRPIRATALPLVGQGSSLLGAVAFFWLEHAV